METTIMGSWGEKLFADDNTIDVRDAWVEHYKLTASARGATVHVLNEFKEELQDSDDGPVV